MLRHVVMMRMSAEASDAEIESIVQSLRALPALIPEIRSYSVGRDAGLADGNFELVVIAEFDDEAGFRSYSANADHQTVIVDKIRPVMAGRSAVQYFIDS